MAKLNPAQAAGEDLLPLVQQLSSAFHAFSLYDAEGLRKSGSGLTPSQARVIFAIGDTDGLTCKDIGDLTQITKGTLTGVVDRLEQKDLVQRWSVEGDGRKTIVALTRKGDRVYAREFPRHVAFLKQRFDKLSERDHRQAVKALAKIRELF